MCVAAKGGGGRRGGIGCPLTALHLLFRCNSMLRLPINATGGRPHGVLPAAITTAIPTDTLEHFGTLEAMAGWNFLEHLKLRGLKGQWQSKACN